MTELIENLHGAVPFDPSEVEHETIDPVEAAEEIEKIRERFNYGIVELIRWVIAPKQHNGKVRRILSIAKVILPEMRGMTQKQFAARYKMGTKQNMSYALKDFCVRFGWRDRWQRTKRNFRGKKLKKAKGKVQPIKWR